MNSKTAVPLEVFENPAADIESLDERQPTDVVNTSVSNGGAANAPAGEGNELNKSLLHKAWQLIGFFRRIFIYLSINALAELNLLYLPDWARVILKCLPIVSLIVFVFRQFNSFRRLWRNKYGLLVFISLIFSLIADACLVFKQVEVVFLVGILCFIISHFLYMFAFGWTPLKSRMLARSILAAALVYYYVYLPSPNGTRVSLGERSLVLKIGGGIYAAVVFGMQWRAWARVSYQDLQNGRWYEFMGAIGASSFVLSDIILVVDLFKFPIVGGDYPLLVFYYLGQMFIALSVLDGKDIKWPRVGDAESGCRACCSSPQTCIRKTPKAVAKWIFY